jgi:hypothetical protein
MKNRWNAQVSVQETLSGVNKFFIISYIQYILRDTVLPIPTPYVIVWSMLVSPYLYELCCSQYTTCAKVSFTPNQLSNIAQVLILETSNLEPSTTPRMTNERL